MANKHDIGVEWHLCNLCNSKFKNAYTLKPHMANKHDIGVEWHPCNLCDSKFKDAGNLERHVAFKHDIGVEWHQCKYCNSKFKEAGNLKTHIADKHDIDVTWFQCEHCDYRSKKAGNLNKHIAHKHDIGVEWHPCNLCDSKFKQASTLKLHIANKHDIGVIWHNCEHCDSKFKQTGTLKKHKQQIHDIGNTPCIACTENHYSSIPYKDTKVCKACFKKATGKNSRKEEIMSQYLDNLRWLKPFLMGSDKSMKSMEGCQLYRPDKLYGSENLVLQVECDENAHKYKGVDYSCDEKRISDIYDEFPGKKHIIIRWNPDKKGIDMDTKLKKLQELIKQTIDYPPDDLIMVYYMYYPEDSNLIVKNLPYLIQN